MAGNSEFEIVEEQGWRRGLHNLMRQGFASWWKTNNWWVQTLIWTGVINFILAGMLWSAQGFNVQDALSFYAIFAGLFPPIAVIIIMQDVVVGEKLSGTAAWVLSKPASRTAFILSKLVPNAVGVAATMVLFPGVLAFVQLVFAGAPVASPLHFLAGLGIFVLNLWFYLTLTLMLGVLTNSRAAVIAIPMAFAFGQQYLLSMVPVLRYVLPWTLSLPPGEAFSGAVVPSVMAGVAPFSWGPVIFVSVCIVVFSAVSLWRFQDQEL